jgi:hypothetical protein
MSTLLMPPSRPARSRRPGLLPTLAIAISLALSGCGGGGGQPDATAAAESNAPLPTVIEDQLPLATATDLSAQHYNPLGVNDSWTYNKLDGEGADTGTLFLRQVSAGSDTGSSVSVTETDGASEPDTTTYAVSVTGLFDSNPLGEAPAAAKAIVGTLLDHPYLFYPQGSVQTQIRQGNWGEDLDGDGLPESFRLVSEISFLGETDISVPTFAISDVHVMHLRRSVVLTIYPSRKGSTPLQVSGTEDNYAMAGVGPVQLVRVVVDTTGQSSQAYTLVLQSAMVNGQLLGIVPP